MIEWLRELVAALILLAVAALAPQSAPPPESPYLPPPEILEALLAHAPPPVVTTPAAIVAAPAGGCALYAGPKLADDVVLDELRRHDWAPFTAETILELFRRESDLYLAAENLCTDDHGVPQINRRYHGSWCDVVSVKTDLRYAITGASKIFADQGSSAWIAAKGWLW